MSAWAFLALCPGARAEYQGTPGKIAYLDGHGGTAATFPLKIWDPAEAVPREPGSGITTAVESTFHFAQVKELVTGEPSTPVFSPDGTQIAYSTLIEDPGVHSARGYHSAIFVMNADGSGQHQVSEPPEALEPPPECEERCPGHDVADYMPSWSPDGKTIAFIRQVAPSEYDSLYPERGENIWMVPATGGAAVQLTHGGDSTVYNSVVWGREGMVTAFTDTSGQHLGLIAEGSSAPVVIASPTAAGEALDDYDVSPDGRKLTYTTTGGGGTSEHVVGTDGQGEEVLHTGNTLSLDRFSNTGNGPLRIDCRPQAGREGAEVEQCGVFEERTPDPEAEGRAGEPPDRFLLPWVDFGGVYVPSSPTRSLWDVQAQQVPIIFIPGFLASTIKACGDTPWPPTVTNALEMSEMDLEPNGETNANCVGAGPDAQPAGSILREIELGGLVASKNVTKTLQENLSKLRYPEDLGPNGTAEEGRPFPVSYFGWDWRRRAHDSVQLLDEEITKVLEEGELQRKEGVGRVVLFGHSYGGLLIRSYEDEHAQRIARVLTVGTPYWGAPKVIFPLAFGRESPFWGLTLDLLTNSTQLQGLARDLAGLYELFPSDAHYGSWLSLSGVPAGHDEIAKEVLSLGGQPSLYAKTQTDHEQVFDGFENGYGRLDYQVVVGAGMPTPGSVNITPTGAGKATVKVNMVNGDTTVPLRSADQGSMTHPLGSQVPIQALCGVEHMDEPNSSALFSAYRDWLIDDRTPRKLEGEACTDAGAVFAFKTKEGLKLFSSFARLPSAARAIGASTVAVGIGEAAEAEDAYVYELDSQLLLATSNRKPLDLVAEATGEEFTYTPINADGSEGTPLVYGPLTGRLELVTGSGAPPQVSVNGEPVAGRIESAGPPVGGEPPSMGGAPAGGGSPTTGPTAPEPVVASNRFRVRRIKARANGTITLTLLAPGAGVFKALGKIWVGRPRSKRHPHSRRRVIRYGSGAASAHGATVISLTIRPSARARAVLARSLRTRVSLKITFIPVGGAARTVATAATVAKKSKHSHGQTKGRRATSAAGWLQAPPTPETVLGGLEAPTSRLAKLDAAD